MLDGAPLGSPVTLDASGRASLTTTALPTGTHRLSAVYSGDGDYASGTSKTVEHVTKGPAEMLADLSAMIDSFNLQNGKSSKFDNTVANIEKHLAAGQIKQACIQLGVLVKKAQQASGKSLTRDQSAQLVAQAARIETQLGC
jgi:Bacterial Ig-like domain (group 3)